MMPFYKLNPDRTVSPATARERTGSAWEYSTRCVGSDEKDGVRVSTVFLVVDHSVAANGPPVLFESMIFGGPLDGEQERYRTWDEAQAGHARWCKKVFGPEYVVGPAGGRDGK